MKEQKSRAREIIEMLDRELISAGFEPTIPEEKKGSFVIIPSPKPKNVIVDAKLENREAFVKRFEEKGFTIEKRFTKEEIIKSVLPITLDFKAKEIGIMGNVTCVAAAASQGAIIKEDNFGTCP